MAFIHLLLVVYAFTYVNTETIEDSSTTEAFQCDMCVDRFNWTDCDNSARPRTCSDELVIATHSFLAQYNINLNGTAPSTSVRQFRCFRLELEIDVATVQVFIRGCTYDDSFFCDGWTENGAKSINCAVCSTGTCERNTTGDVSPTTTTSTTAVGTSSTTHNSPVTTTTTVKTPVTTDGPCIVDWTTTTTAEKQSTTTTKADGDLENPTISSTDTAKDAPFPSDSHITPVPSVLPPEPTKVVEDTTTTTTAEPTPPSDLDVTPVPIVQTTTEAYPSGVQGRFIGMSVVAFAFLVSVGGIFVAKY